MEIVRVRLPLAEPFRTASGVVADREVVFVAVGDGSATGWAEAAPYPGVTVDTADSIWRSLRTDPASSPMAAAAVANAESDLAAIRRRRTLAEHIGAMVGAPAKSLAVGLDADLRVVARRASEEGFDILKLKVTPETVLDRVEAARSEASDLTLAVDANGSFDPAEDGHHALLASLDVAYIEQPFAPGRLAATARLRSHCAAPVALDEEIRSAEDGIRVIRAGAADILVVKPGLLGLRATLALHAAAVSAGLRIKASGLLETSIGRAYTNAVAGLPGAAYSDVAPAGAFLAVDPVEPSLYGIGVRLDRDAADRYVVDEDVVDHPG